MRIGTILENTRVPENSDRRFSIYTGLDDNIVKAVRLYEDTVINTQFSCTQVGPEFEVRPVGEIDVKSILENVYKERGIKRED